MNPTPAPQLIRLPTVEAMSNKEEKALEAIRAFVADLREHIEHLRTGKRRMGSRRLAEFRSSCYGEDDAFYPLDWGGRPWRKHRVAVTRAELAAAGYEEYYRGWRWAPNADPWRHIYWGGEVPLWRSDAPGAEHETRLRRARFLEHLSVVLESRMQPKAQGGGGTPFSGTHTAEKANRGLCRTPETSSHTGKAAR